MSREAEIIRCPACGAPLPDVATAAVVVCPYCRAESHVAETAAHIQGKVRRLEVASAEADRIARDNEARGQSLMAEHQALLERFLRGETGVGPDVLRTFEGYMRLQFAPTLHVYGAAGMDDPKIVAALAEIDVAVDSAVRELAERLRIERA